MALGAEGKINVSQAKSKKKQKKREEKRRCREDKASGITN